jgi:hypothetical protein
VSNQVYANNMEVSCKKAAGKSICAFPDVCMTPPQTPATPPGVPIPYPNTAMASDTSDGSASVKISGQEVMLKNKSSFKRSTGDEAGAAPLKGVVTHKNMGKVYFNAWSMDVKVEGENVVRMLDLTTHNHSSFPGNSPTWPYIDEAAFSADSTHPCAEVAQKAAKECGDLVVKTKKGNANLRKRQDSIDAMCKKPECKKAMECVLTPKSPSNCCSQEVDDGSGGKVSVPDTPHHIVPASQFHSGGESGVPLLTDSSGADKYSYDKAPCICASGSGHSVGKHGQIHGETNTRTRAFLGVPAGTTIPPETRWPVTFAERVGAEAVEDATGCPKACTQEQLKKGHESMGIKRSDMIRPTTAGGEAAAGGPIPLPG